MSVSIYDAFINVTTKSVLLIVLNNCIRYTAILISNKSNGTFEGLQKNLFIAESKIIF